MAQDNEVLDTGVNEPAEDTAVDSPVEEQTAEVEEAQAPEAEEKSVPYSRFKEVNEQLKQMRSELDQVKAAKEQSPAAAADPQTEAVKEQLRKLGFTTREEMEQELARREQDAQVQQEIAKLEGTYSGSDGRPKFDRQEIIDFALKRGIADLEVAYKTKHEKALIDWHVKQAVSKTKGVASEASDGSGSSQAGTTNDDLKEGIKAGDKNALRTFLKRVASGS